MIGMNSYNLVVVVWIILLHDLIMDIFENMDKVVCQISWTIQDFADAFAERKHRQPTKEELTKCIDNFSYSKLQDYSIENGWDFIYEAIDKL